MRRAEEKREERRRSASLAQPQERQLVRAAKGAGELLQREKSSRAVRAWSRERSSGRAKGLERRLAIPFFRSQFQ